MSCNSAVSRNSISCNSIVLRSAQPGNPPSQAVRDPRPGPEHAPRLRSNRKLGAGRPGGRSSTAAAVVAWNLLDAGCAGRRRRHRGSSVRPALPGSAQETPAQQKRPALHPPHPGLVWHGCYGTAVTVSLVSDYPCNHRLVRQRHGCYDTAVSAVRKQPVSGKCCVWRDL